MIKMEIKMDEERMGTKKGLNVPYFLCEIERLFLNLELPRVGDEPGHYVFRDKGDPSDYARFGRAAITLSHQKWFLENALEWYFYMSDDMDEPEKLVREDFLAHYRAKRGVCV